MSESGKKGALYPVKREDKDSHPLMIVFYRHAALQRLSHGHVASNNRSRDVFETAVFLFEKERASLKKDFPVNAYGCRPKAVEALLREHLDSYIDAVQRFDLVVPRTAENQAMREDMIKPMAKMMAEDVKSLPLRNGRKTHVAEYLSDRTRFDVTLG